LVANNPNSPSGIQTIRVHHNTIDMETRAKGAGYGVELTMHDVEIDHNYFFKGSYGIANWAQHAMKNWNIHHNVFYALEGVYPGDILRAERSGLHNVNFYNNTVEFTGDKTMNVIGLYGGTSENVNVVNNLFINNNTAYSYYANTLIHMENGSVVNNLAVKNNFFDSLSAGSVSGTYSNNLEGDPKIYKKDQRPTPYYQPTPGSPLLGAGLTDSTGFNGMTADIGAFEYDESLFNEAPHVTIDNPSDNSVFYTGSAITVTANVSDSTGTITDVQYYNGTIKLGQAVVSPYTFTINDLPEGNYSLTAIAKDNFDAVDTSAAVNIRVVSWIKLGLYAPDAALSGYMTLINDSTASKGSYFLIPAGHGTNYTIGASAAQFNFELSKSDNYTMWVRVIAPGPDNQGYYLYDGKGHWTTWMAGVFDEWTWVRVTDAYTNEVATFPFTTGMNILVFSWLHEDVHVDQVLITNNPEFVPSVKGENGGARTKRSLTTEFVQPEVPEISKGVLIYPNPVRDDFTLTYHSPVAQQAEIKIITMTSVIAKQTTVPITQGVNAIKIGTANLRNGMYVVAFITSTGDHFVTKISVSK
ncbi:MAG: Ig-like domain-containing protein, partial [Cyclobacteriaceae bacterium]